MAEAADAGQQRRQSGGEGGGDEDRLGPAVGQDVADQLVRQQRVDRDRHDARAEAAPEDDREIHRIRQQQRHPPFPPDAGGGEPRGEPVGGGVERPVVERPRPVADRERLAPTFADVPVEEEIDRVGVAGGGRFHSNQPSRTPAP